MLRIAQIEAQVGKDAAIIDERFNHGGHLATDIIEYLRRGLMSVASYRDGADTNQPSCAIVGPKVMIINESARRGRPSGDGGIGEKPSGATKAAGVSELPPEVDSQLFPCVSHIDCLSPSSS